MTVLLAPVMAAILGAVADSLDPTPARVVLIPGEEVAWDDCCAGQLALRLISLEPVGKPERLAGCGPAAWRATLGLSMVRCVSALDDSGTVPSADQVSEDGEAVALDVTALERTLTCVVKEIRGVERLTLINWLPLGPSGGCAGGEWMFSINMDACACEES